MKSANVSRIVYALMLAAGQAFAQATQSSSEAPLEPKPAVPEVDVFGPEQQEFRANLQDVLFAYDVYEQPVNQDALRADAQWLQQHPDIRFYLFGHADWRGSILYNLLLSRRRAETVKQELVGMGIAPDRIVIPVGWGKLSPTCAEQTESCFQQNRRVRFVYIPKGWQPEPATAPSSGR
jgi:peptidoglycan-associated lipoprotein